LLHKYNVAIPLGNVAFNGQQAYDVAKELEKQKLVDFVVKA
jgi:hypothetical protein